MQTSGLITAQTLNTWTHQNPQKCMSDSSGRLCQRQSATISKIHSCHLEWYTDIFRLVILIWPGSITQKRPLLEYWSDREDDRKQHRLSVLRWVCSCALKASSSVEWLMNSPRHSLDLSQRSAETKHILNSLNVTSGPLWRMQLATGHLHWQAKFAYWPVRHMAKWQNQEFNTLLRVYWAFHPSCLTAKWEKNVLAW